MFLCDHCRERLSHRLVQPSIDTGICDLCGNLMEHVDDYFEMFKEESKRYEFSTFLIGVRTSKESLQKDREIIESAGTRIRSYKEEFQFLLGSKIERELHYTVDFGMPEFVFMVSQENMDYSIKIKSVYIKGRYLKKRRGIPQSPWIKPGRGKEMEKSVSEYIGQQVCNAFEGKNYNFFALGREDVDALMLGTGRPFYVQVETPTKRSIDLTNLSERVLMESKEGVEIIDISMAKQSEIDGMKDLRPDKTYEVGLTIEEGNRSDLEEVLKKYSNFKIDQRTPSRVLNIRKDKTRERRIRSIEIERFSGKQLILIITAEAGTYIKEFITGDNGRTVPSLKNELNINVKIDYLNVLEVK
jgi:tRNA pseudouridine synthase 10